MISSFCFEHDSAQTLSRLSRGKTGSHFSGSCSSYFQGVTGGTLSLAGGTSTVLKSAGLTISRYFHVRRVIVEIVHDPRTLMDDVAGLHQGRLVFIHESGPALGHDDDLEIAFVLMPAGALFPAASRDLALTRWQIT